MATKKENKYIKHRKQSLESMKNLIYQRYNINKDIRNLKSEMNAWDKALITEI